jgi:methionyl-tRNA formyltransferase
MRRGFSRDPSNRVDRIRLALFALTGVGNVVLERLVSSGLEPDLLVTRTESGVYPYGKLPFIGEAADQLGIPWCPDSKGEQSVRATGAELLLVATYHRILPTPLLSNCRAAINLHPSLLPSNRGPNPFFWSIFNGDQLTGVTAHAIAPAFDEGPICMQQSIQINNGETQTTLRRRLSCLAADMSVDLVRKFQRNQITFSMQEEEKATKFPKVGLAERRLDLAERAETIMRHINALRDWPLALLFGQRVRRVISIDPPKSTAAPGTLLAAVGSICKVRVADADMCLELDEAFRSD